MSLTNEIIGFSKGSRVFSSKIMLLES